MKRKIIILVASLVIVLVSIFFIKNIFINKTEINNLTIVDKKQISEKIIDKNNFIKLNSKKINWVPKEQIIYFDNGKEVNLGYFGLVNNEFDKKIFKYKDQYLVILSWWWLSDNDELREYSLDLYDLKENKKINIVSGLDGCDEICISKGGKWKVEFKYKTKEAILKKLRELEKEGKI